jgi:predicted metal-dependent phosphoesterase TrpH
VSSHTGSSPTGTADLHIHTHFSDGADSPRDVLRWAERKRLDVIAITDHDTIEGARVAAQLARESRSNPDVIIGEEVSSADGHILGLFLTERVPPGLSAEETVAAIHEQGGLAVAAHPFWRHDGNNRRGWVYSVGRHIEHVSFDAVEVPTAASRRA